jgi:hypothetical protein
MAVRIAAVKNAAPGKYTGAAGLENRPKIWVMRGGPRIELRL